jgi:hypothetical protein
MEAAEVIAQDAEPVADKLEPPVVEVEEDSGVDDSQLEAELVQQVCEGLEQAIHKPLDEPGPEVVEPNVRSPVSVRCGSV